MSHPLQSSTQAPSLISFHHYLPPPLKSSTLPPFLPPFLPSFHQHPSFLLLSSLAQIEVSQGQHLQIMHFTTHYSSLVPALFTSIRLFTLGTYNLALLQHLSPPPLASITSTWVIHKKNCTLQPLKQPPSSSHPPAISMNLTGAIIIISSISLLYID